ncbi:MAG: NAD-dependent epimerase/dehydratase family protein, partial [Verrucomicrobia bacterium]|nr:NAD-dependent epimerase/dehydratase family protein [Verrucomicrobiota bacterium]
PASLDEALRDVTHVLHCAGAVKALRTSGFYEVNQAGTGQLVAKVNQRLGQIQRMVHISSLAAAGPSLPHQPVREEDLPHPVSDYGRSKLAGEREVTEGCKAPFVVLRPPAVYGPRDREFLRLFQIIQKHLLPRLGGGRQLLSLVFVQDLAEAALAVLTHPKAEGRTFFVASPEIVTARALAEAIATQMGRWTVPLPLPLSILWPVCAWQELRTRLTGQPSVLGWQKLAELRAPAWVCDPSRLRQELGVECTTRLQPGLVATLEWYRQQGWL